jgi:hypothetical protein
MDSALATAAQALSRGDPLLALKQVALRSDARALALRATALAQLGEYRAAKQLLERASRAFGPRDPLARARCTVALADVALASRELTFADAALARAISLLARAGDLVNARYGQLLRARHALARGELETASVQLSSADTAADSPVLAALLALSRAELAVRLLRPAAAVAALALAAAAARTAGVPALAAEVSAARQALRRPAARLVSESASRLLSLDQVAQLNASDRFVVDGCRRVVRAGARVVDFASRPVLFNLLRQLAQVAPQELDRALLIRAGFGIQRANESLRVRLRMSMARLRKLLRGLAEVQATPRGFALAPRKPPVYLLLPPGEDEASSLLALLSDGEAWSTSALALALGASQRSVQRALSALAQSGKVSTFGRGKSRRWLAAPLTRFATPLLLPVTSPRS